jgi:ketosteroid isomerase-like protein
MPRVLATFTALAIAVILGGCAGKSCPSGASEAGGAPDDEVAAAQRAVEAWRTAWEARDADQLFALYDHGDALAVVTQGSAVIGWDTIKAQFTERLGRAKGIRLKLNNVKVSPVGAGAVAVAELSREVSDGVTSVTDAGTLTLAFARDGERWVIVGEHYSFRPR